MYSNEQQFSISCLGVIQPRMKVQRYKCKNRDCDYDRQESIPFVTGSCGYTHRFAKYVVDLLRSMTLKDAANLLGVSWDTVKDIHTRHLEYHYAPPSLEGVDSRSGQHWHR